MLRTKAILGCALAATLSVATVAAVSNPSTCTGGAGEGIVGAADQACSDSTGGGVSGQISSPAPISLPNGPPTNSNNPNGSGPEQDDGGPDSGNDPGDNGSPNGNDGGPTTGGSGATSSTGYNLEIAGVYTGAGSATVTAGSLQLSANIQDAGGNSGTLNARLTLANGHFSGTGTAMGQPITLAGRVDPADATSRKLSVVQAARIVSTFATTSGLHGRIFGSQSGAPSH